MEIDFGQPPLPLLHSFATLESGRVPFFCYSSISTLALFQHSSNYVYHSSSLESGRVLLFHSFIIAKVCLLPIAEEWNKECHSREWKSEEWHSSTLKIGTLCSTLQSSLFHSREWKSDRTKNSIFDFDCPCLTIDDLRAFNLHFFGYSGYTSRLKPLSLRTRLVEPFTTNQAERDFMLHFL